MYALGLIGYPLEHSLSPRLHGAALRTLGLAGDYQLYPVPPLPQGAPGLAQLLAQVQRGQLHGLNVTIPHKQSVQPLLGTLTPAAQAIGAVNTIFCQDGQLCGDNTDAPGFLQDLQRLQLVGGPDGGSAPGHALVLGAGGSARAVVYALLGAGWRVSLAARRVAQAQALLVSLGEPAGRAYPLEVGSLQSLAAEVNLLVNTTPVGMWPRVEASPWPAGAPLPPGALVYDLVYNPPETELVRTARQAGLLASSGLGMLVEQAALALERWTGRSVPRRPMWLAVPEFLPADDRFLDGGIDDRDG